MGGKNCFEVLEVSKNRGFEKSGLKLQCLIQGKRAMVKKKPEVEKTRDRKIGISLYAHALLWRKQRHTGTVILLKFFFQIPEKPFYAWTLVKAFLFININGWRNQTVEI